MSRPPESYLPASLQSFLEASGLELDSWAALLLSIFFVLPADWRSWKKLFPHVDFDRLHPDDLVKIPLQLLWLLLVEPPPPPAYPRKRPLRFRLKKSYRIVQEKIERILPREYRQRVSARMAEKEKLLHESISSFRKRSEPYASRWLWDRPAARYVAYASSALLVALCITTPFGAEAQLLYGAFLLIASLILRRHQSQIITLFLILLSIVNSTRYLWWRLTYTLNWDHDFDLTWGLLLLAAECYTWIILIFAYIQTAWPLKRIPVPLPDDHALWPTVDIYIPTYNEPLKVVKPTIYSALGIDWPAEKLNIYLLDDGRREEFRLFAQECGVHYITRPDNRHAKAGNLNHALQETSGEYIAIFDCDHIPARSFLQVTMGWFLKDPKIAVIQTPHHFFSPDPFEKNLGVFHRVPNEGELFYGLIQDGNDLWDATFFCGSCAVLKRAPLLEIGGVAVDTVTEDAHTSLKLHRKGYTSAYLNIPQASGLATESLSLHIGQRIRWARGMAQIFRLDNPLFGKGLNWMQRVCYSSAMIHYLNGIPKLIFLTAPLAFLLFHAYIIYASAVSVALYVIPHMMSTNIANSRLQGKYRHSFWAEVYETVLAWYIAIPTTMALINPRKGKFNVTAKGGLVATEYFDWTISSPYLLLATVNFIGLFFGIWRMGWGPDYEQPTVVLNIFWTLYNIIILGGAVAVAAEARQIRRSHRVALKIPAALRLPDGKLIRAHTEDFSSGGMALNPERMPILNPEDRVSLLLKRGNEEFAFAAKVVATSEPIIRLRWDIESEQQAIDLAQCTVDPLELRRSPRFKLKIRAGLRLSSGKMVSCHTENVSTGGLALVPEYLPDFAPDEEAMPVFWRGSREYAFPATVVSAVPGRVRLQWDLDSTQQAELVQCTFGRADAWISRLDEPDHDHPLEGLKEVVALGITGYARLFAHSLPHMTPLAELHSRIGSRFKEWLPRTPLTEV